MKVNTISKQSFGKIVMNEQSKEDLFKDILDSKINEKECKEMILDALDASSDPNRTVTVKDDGIVMYHDARKGVSHSVVGPCLLKNFASALRSCRSDKVKALLAEQQYKEYALK